ncbi:sugar transferase [Tropicimonas sp. S265A]|uniref:sugar transferase n=1 Tax=Tropicimonas sp. S265A TaxID=3415134 RepID=UPI003C7B483D
MTLAKRLCDLIGALALAVLLSPLIAGLALWVWLTQGGPVLHASERMGQGGRPFTLWKFRTMAHAIQDGGVTGADKTARITPQGRVLRRTRLDELPQLWNILRGEMSFVGPRPPLRLYVARFPDLYAQVLRSRPGVTGLATLVYHAHEERLLSGTVNATETDAVYARRCVPRKARLDLIYARHRTICMDLWILGRTVRKVFGP